MKYKSVVATKRGGPEVLQIVENEMRAPTAGEVQIKVLATGVGRTDINYRYGYSPFSPKAPFVPGYEIVGVVEAIGTGVTRVAVGERVAALTGHGGYTEIIYLGQEHLVPVPAALVSAEVAVLVLNYVSAWQMLHRVAKVKTGNKVLLIGASGGVGTALLQLGHLASLKIYGTASPEKRAFLTGLGAIPIDYHTQDFVALLKKAEPDGLDFVFDGMGGVESQRGLQVLRNGGRLVAYAPPTGIGKLLKDLIKMISVNMRREGRKIDTYGITAIYARDKKPFMEDLPVLFKLLEEGKIKPVISQKFPLLEAAKANQVLESGTVIGNIVLLAPELL